MTIEEIKAKLAEIAGDGEQRSLTAEEITRYEELETELAAAQETARKSEEIRKRQAVRVSPDLSAAVNVGEKRDTGLEDAYADYLRSGVPNADITELRAQGTGTGSTGGYLVPPGWRQKLVEVTKAYGGLAAHVENVPSSDGITWVYPSNDDTANQGAITAESATFAAGQDLTFGQVSLPTFKYTSSGANVSGTQTPLRVSVEMIQDSGFPIEDLVTRRLATRILKKVAVDIATGGGTTAPVGIVNSTLTADKALATGTTITYNDLLDLEATLDPSYEQNAKWVFSKATWTAIRKIVDGANRPLIFEQAQAGAGLAPVKTLLGYPVVLASEFPAPTGTSTNFAVLGDLAESYVLRTVGDLAVNVNPYSRANFGEIEFTAWQRFGGAIQNRKAYSVLATHA